MIICFLSTIIGVVEAIRVINDIFYSMDPRLDFIVVLLCVITVKVNLDK